MANPRKFSEKIALHNQKQAEETAAFEQIMREVIGATRGAYQKHHLHINPSLGSYRGGSLPNVNQIGNNSIDLQSALNSLEDMKQGRETLTERVPRERGRHATPHRNRQFPFEKRADVSPYSSTSFLSPPPDSSWRRTNSDSALHQSATNPQENFHSANSPLSQRRGIVNDVDGSLTIDGGPMKNYWDPKKGLTVDTNALSLDSYVLHQQSFGVYPQQSPNTHQNFVYETAAPTSPTLPQISTGSYRSTSPADHSCSAPTSPVSHNFSPASSPGLGPASSLSKSPFTDTNYYQHQQQQTSALQHQLEQFKMIPESNLVCSSANSNTVHTNTPVYMPSMDSCDCGPPVEGDLLMSRSLGLHYPDNVSHGISATQDGLGNSVMYYNIPNLSEPQLQSPTLYSKNVISQQTAPQTPQTPTSIPDIILTDNLQAFSPSKRFTVQQHDTNEIPFLDVLLSLQSAPGADDPMMRQDFAKDLGSAMVSMSGSFESDLFTPDDALRAGLDPIDFDGLQILTDPDIPVISDPATEETFRLDRS